MKTFLDYMTKLEYLETTMHMEKAKASFNPVTFLMQGNSVNKSLTSSNQIISTGKKKKKFWIFRYPEITRTYQSAFGIQIVT